MAYFSPLKIKKPQEKFLRTEHKFRGTTLIPNKIWHLLKKQDLLFATFIFLVFPYVASQPRATLSDMILIKNYSSNIQLLSFYLLYHNIKNFSSVFNLF